MGTEIQYTCTEQLTVTHIAVYNWNMRNEDLSLWTKVNSKFLFAYIIFFMPEGD